MPTLALFQRTVDAADRHPQDDKNQPIHVFDEAAQLHNDKMQFVHATVKGAKDFANFLGVTNKRKELPLMFAFEPKTMLKYKYEQNTAEMTVEDVAKFIDDVKSGAVTPHLKSQDPAKNNGPMTTVVGIDFD